MGRINALFIKPGTQKGQLFNTGNIFLDRAHLKYGKRQSVRVFFNEDITGWEPSFFSFVRSDKDGILAKFKNSQDNDLKWALNKRVGRNSLGREPVNLTGVEFTGNLGFLDLKAFFVDKMNSAFVKNSNLTNFKKLFRNTPILYGFNLRKKYKYRNKSFDSSLYLLGTRLPSVAEQIDLSTSLIIPATNAQTRHMIGTYQEVGLQNILFMDNLYLKLALVKSIASLSNSINTNDNGWSYGINPSFRMGAHSFSVYYRRSSENTIRDLTTDWNHSRSYLSFSTTGKYGEAWSARLGYSVSKSYEIDETTGSSTFSGGIGFEPGKKVLKFVTINASQNQRSAGQIAVEGDDDIGFTLNSRIRIKPIPVSFGKKLTVNSSFRYQTDLYKSNEDLKNVTFMNELSYLFPLDIFALVSLKNRFQKGVILNNFYFEVKYMGTRNTEILMSYGMRPYIRYVKYDNEDFTQFGRGTLMSDSGSDETHKTVKQFTLQAITRF